MATGRPIAEVLSQPADLTLWTYWQWVDAERVKDNRAELDRADLSKWIAAASWDGKEHSRAEEALMHRLRRHPDPEIEQKLIAERVAKGFSLIERPNVIGGKKE